MNSKISKEQKTKDASERLTKWESMTTNQKIADLDLRLGKGQGAVKQRARIAKQLEVEKTATAPKPEKTDKKKSQVTIGLY